MSPLKSPDASGTSRLVVLGAVILAIACLYWARIVFIPIALAILTPLGQARSDLLRLTPAPERAPAAADESASVDTPQLEYLATSVREAS